MKFLLSAALFIMTAAVYCRTASYPLSGLDIGDYITQNDHVLSGLTPASIKWAFTTAHTSNWHPLTWLSHMADCQFFGLNPMGPHLVNVTLHGVNTVLLFILLCTMTGALWQSLCVAALFALHPLHVESVAWVAERKDVLSTLFWMLSLLFYGAYVKQAKRTFYVLTLISFVLGLMAKQMLVTLPLVLLLLDFWPLGRFRKSLPPAQHSVWLLLGEKVPFLLLSVGASVVTLFTQGEGGALASGTTLRFSMRAANAALSYVSYIRKTLWPADLAAYYSLTGVSYPRAALALLVIAVISLLVCKGMRRYPYLAMGWLWYGVTLVPVIGLVQVGGQSMADRYTYIPIIGLFIMIVWGGAEIGARLPRFRTALIAVCVSLVLGCAVLTWNQVRYWHDDITLLTHALAVTDNNYMAHIFLGNALLEQGEADQAIAQYHEALKTFPNYELTIYSLGTAYDQQGRTEQAISQYRLALKIKPDYGEARHRLGIDLDNQGKTAEAVQQLVEAVRLVPDFVEGHYDLGIALDHLGRSDQAIAEYYEALRLRPDFAACHNNLAVALLQQKKYGEALRHFSEALRLAPDLESARTGMRLASQGLGGTPDAAPN
ncbi:tetratricopeptide repeat protein [Oryzomonas sagensis]|uniref:Tetratricopeptide repeat protein n=1 Tax=Oryzomonas sagensis TaxID=2603857 RepID=A0ABQ6TP18_9BACT|nr:tetratricopeptide repeat protein [Oryzomonas sagensis]KAB0670275.1 tetratricopeptide repeat protein [Oryzomonas sagensis]